jgi:hypothetical protein
MDVCLPKQTMTRETEFLSLRQPALLGPRIEGRRGCGLGGGDRQPETLRPWVVDVAERLQVPADFPAAALIVMLAGVLGRRALLRPHRYDPWVVFPNLPSHKCPQSTPYACSSRVESGFLTALCVEMMCFPHGVSARAGSNVEAFSSAGSPLLHRTLAGGRVRWSPVILVATENSAVRPAGATGGT